MAKVLRSVLALAGAALIGATAQASEIRLGAAKHDIRDREGGIDIQFEYVFDRMPVLQGRGRGDLVIEIAVETPTRLSKEQRALLEQFRELETGDECPESRGFFNKLKDALGG